MKEVIITELFKGVFLSLRVKGDEYHSIAQKTCNLLSLLDYYYQLLFKNKKTKGSRSREVQKIRRE